jgi:exodeoxyribonuclease VIII
MTPLDLAPGVYPGISSADYHTLPYCSNSRLTLLKRSPAHLLADLTSPPEQTPAMKLGTAIHSAVLEPHDFARRYTVAFQCDALKKDRTRCTNSGTHRVRGEWRCGVHPADGERDVLEVLTAADFAVCEGVAAAVRRHPRIGKLLAGDGENELTVVWDDPATGVRCKARIDRLKRGFGGILVDLKSTTDARADAFERKAFEMGYYRQAGFYQDALRAHGIETGHMVIVAVEKEPPFAVAGYRLAESAADAGREELRGLLARYAECQERGEWPGYTTDITELSLPAYAWRSMEIAA